jgi:hypothetical protein
LGGEKIAKKKAARATTATISVVFVLGRFVCALLPPVPVHHLRKGYPAETFGAQVGASRKLV